MTPNEARAKMDLEPYAGGDKFYLGLQGAMVDPTIEPLGKDEHSPTENLTELVKQKHNGRSRNIFT